MRFKDEIFGGWENIDEWVYEIRKLKGLKKRPVLVKLSYFNGHFQRLSSLDKEAKTFLERNCRLIYVPEKEEIKDKEYLELFI